jgi:hypothetical protein
MTTRKTLLATLASLALGVLAPGLAFASPFEIHNFAAEANNEDGSLYTQAGGRPYSATASFSISGGSLKDAITEIPPGFIGNPQAAPQCPVGRLTDETNQCPSDTQVGIAIVALNGSLAQYPVYNLAPEFGHPAELGFALFGDSTPAILYASLRSDGDYGVTISGRGLVQGGALSAVTFTLWGVPADPSHDALRWDGREDPGTGHAYGFGARSGAPVLPLLSNPVDCQAGPLATTLRTDAWQVPGALNSDGSPDLSDPNWVSASSLAPAVTNCAALSFAPTFAFNPDTTAVDSPTGASVDLSIPPTNDPGLLATPELRDATVALPAGVTVSPSSADGLQACGAAQIGIGSTQPANCPDASQIGSVEVHTPLLDHPLPGVVFLGDPECGPCTNADAASGRLLHLYVAVNDPQTGVVVKLPGTVTADPSTGQLTASFKQNPQLPFSDLHLSFKSGPRAPLATPTTCGAYTTTTDLAPWSAGGANGTPDATPSSTFDVSWDGSGGMCPATLPFAPSFTAGTANVLANEFTPLTLTFARSDGQQTLSRISTQLPPGLLGMISPVPLCAEAQASNGTCSAASLIGHTTVAAGPGPHPFYVSGSVYLTGPYKGAPFGLSVVVPAVAGPFNLGNVVVRAAINVDPHDVHATVTSDPFPQSLAGVPLRIQTVNVTIDRPGFVFNPTNCSQQSIRATIASGQGAGANVSSPFEAGGCKGLPFSPKMTATLAGRSSKKNGAALKVKIVEGVAGEANVHSIKVELPKQLPSRLTTLQKACTAAVFEANPASCPAASVIGSATATTPVLPVPLSGPAMLVSHGGEAFPDLVVVLQGDGVTIDLVGNTSIKKGITSSTFATVPDAPVDTFELNLPSGPYSILATNLPAGKNYNFCGSKLSMPTRIVAQNGAELRLTTKIAVSGCPKAKSAGNKKSKAKQSSHKHRGNKAGATRSAKSNRRLGR